MADELPNDNEFQRKRRELAKRVVRAPGVLEAAARDIQYEFRMLQEAVAYILSSAPVASPLRDEAAYALESFLLHYRNLRAFLCPSLQSIREDDVIASDYLDKTEAEDIGAPSDLGIDQKRIDQLLAHISYARAAYARSGDMKWCPQVMATRIETAMKEFLQRLPPERRRWFEESR